MIKIQSMDTLPDGREAHVCVITAGRAEARVSDYGATLLSLTVPDRAGNLVDVVLGFASLADYCGPNGACYGATIGPSANRSFRAEVPLGDKVYHLEANEGANNLHSSLERGLHHHLWDASPAEDGAGVTLACHLADGELGLPGNRTFTASFSLAEKDGAYELAISYRCATDAPTFVNVTNHTYFNLAGHDAGSVMGHLAQANADAFVAQNGEKISRAVQDVTETPFDLRRPRVLADGAAMGGEQIEQARGYDHCLCVRGYEPDAAPRPALLLQDPASGRTLEVLVTTPGVHLYTGNWLDDPHAKDGATYGPQAGIAIEPEFYPDCPHHPDWPQPVCTPDHPFASTTVYRFSAAPRKVAPHN